MSIYKISFCEGFDELVTCIEGVFTTSCVESCTLRILKTIHHYGVSAPYAIFTLTIAA